MEKVKGVLFDLGGTLLEYRREEVLSALLREKGISIPLSDVLHAYGVVEPEWIRQFWVPAPEKERDMALRKLDRMLLEHLQVNGNLDSLSQYVQENWDRMDRELPAGQVRRAFPDALPGVKAVIGKGMKTGIVSNIQSEQHLRRELQTLGMLELFPVLVASGSVGIEKPDRAIFDLAAGKIRLQPREIMFVGDDFERDYQGSLRAGMKPVLIDRSGNYPGQANLNRVSSLEHVPIMLP